MKKTLCILLALVMMIGLLAGCGNKPSEGNTPADDSTSKLDKVYTLTLSHHDPSTSVNAIAMEEWAADVEAATNGRVKIDIFAGSALGAPADGLEMLSGGMCDVLWTTTGFFSGQFPYTEIFQVPMLGIETPTQGTNLFWDLYEKFPEAYENEYKDYKLLIMYASPTSVIGTNKPVNTIEDMKGLRLRCVSGPLSEVCQEWGAVPTGMPPADIYTSVEKSVLDGFFFEWGGVKGYNLNEITESYLDVQAFVNPLFILVNNDVWNGLPADIQEQIASVSYRTGSMKFAEVSEEFTNQAVAEAKAAGIPIVKPEGEALEGFRVGADKVAANWITRLTTDTVDAQAIYDTAREILSK